MHALRAHAGGKRQRHSLPMLFVLASPRQSVVWTGAMSRLTCLCFFGLGIAGAERGSWLVRDGSGGELSGLMVWWWVARRARASTRE